MKNKFSYISENKIKLLEERKILKPYSLSLPSKAENRKGNHVFAASIAIMPSRLKTFTATLPAFLIQDNGQRLAVPLFLLDIDEESKELLKKQICELIDDVFEVNKTTTNASRFVSTV